MLLTLSDNPIWITNGDTLGVAQKITPTEWLVKMGSTIRRIDEKEFYKMYIPLVIAFKEDEEKIFMENE